MDKKNKLTLFQKLFTLCILGIMIPMLLFNMYSSCIVKGILEQRAKEELQNRVILMTSNTENILKNLLLQVIGFLDSNEIKNIAYRLDHIEGDSRKEQLNDLNLSFTNSISHIMELNRIYQLNMELHIWMVNNKGDIISNFSYDPVLMKKGIEIAKERMSKNINVVNWVGSIPNSNYYGHRQSFLLALNSYVGYKIKEDSPVLYVGIKESTLRDRMNVAVESDLHTVFLIDDKQQIISSNKPEYINTSLYEYLAKDRIQGKKVLTNAEFRSERSLVVHQCLKNIPLSIVDIKPYSNILGSINKKIQEMLFINMLFIIVFLVIVALLIRRITRPLRQLQHQMVTFPLTEPVNEEQVPKEAGREVVDLYRQYAILKKNIIKLLNQQKQEEKHKRELEMMTLQAQIKPHFLFNTLMSIRCAITNGHQKKAADMTLALSRMMRESIIKTDETIFLSKEIEILQQYILLQNMRSYQQIKFNISIEEGLEAYRIPKLLIQPLVENSIIHGFKERERGKIELIVRRKQEWIEIILEDDGIGLPDEIITHSLENKLKDHIGLYSVKERIRLYYGKEYELKFENNMGARIVVILPSKWGE